MSKYLFRIVFAASLLMCHIGVNAQQADAPAVRPAIAFGYLSYKEVLKQMPEYLAAQKSISALRDKYNAEMKRVEDDFRTKYEQFLDGQRDFAPSILQKRQAELQDLMQRNAAFKQESEQLLAKSEAAAMAPVYDKLNAAIARVGQSRQFAFILNTDNNNTPYINTLMGTDVTAYVINMLK